MFEKVKFIYMKNTSTRTRKEFEFILLLLSGTILLSPLFVFIHELGHVVTAVLFNCQIEEFVVGYDYGYVRFTSDSVARLDQFTATLIFASGGLLVTFVILLIAKMFYKPLRTLIVLHFPYAIWEGMKGFILYGDYNYVGVCVPFLNSMNVVLNTSVIFFFLLVGIEYLLIIRDTRRSKTGDVADNIFQNVRIEKRKKSQMKVGV